MTKLQQDITMHDLQEMGVAVPQEEVNKRAMQREYDPPSYEDTFAWLTNTGECGKETLKYLQAARSEARIAGIREVLTHLYDQAAKSDDSCQLVVLTKAANIVSDYLDRAIYNTYLCNQAGRK